MNIKPESAHSINGVAGRMFAVNKPPAPWKPGTFASQKWTSEGRKVKGYGTNGVMHVHVQFDDECKNGKNSFAITASIYTTESRKRRDTAAGGCMHEEIARIFPGLAHLIKWHLCDIKGPMYYIENTLYHARQHGPNRAWVYYTGQIDPLGLSDKKERSIGYLTPEEVAKVEGVAGYRVEWDKKTEKIQNLDFARSSAAWPDAPDSALCRPESELCEILEARLPALLDAMRSDIESAGFLWACPETLGVL